MYGHLQHRESWIIIFWKIRHVASNRISYQEIDCAGYLLFLEGVSSIELFKFSLMAKFNSAREKNCSFRRAAEIYVDTFLTVPSALDLFWGLRTRAGIIDVP